MKIHRDLFLIKWGCNVLKRSETSQCFRNLLLIVIAFLLWSPTTYSQNEVGNIHGKLIDKKSDKSIANHPVILKIHKAGDVTQQETTTDENGNYRFENLPLDIETHYTVSTNYDGREHIEKDLVLSSFVPNIVIDIEIGEVTDDPSQIQIKSFTILIGSPPAALAKEGVVVVNEFLNVENLNTSPFQIVRDGETIGFNFDLPKTHKGFHPHPHAPKSLKLSSTGSHIILTDPLPHGSTLIVYEYLYPVNSAEFDLSRRMPFRTDQIAILIQDGINLVPHSKHFKSAEYEAINNVVYKAYPDRKGGFSSGKIVDLNLGIPKPESNMGQMAFIAIAAALAGGFLVAAIFMLRRAQRASKESDDAQPTATDAGWLRKLSDVDLEHARTARLEFITQLDEAHEKQDISERVYNRFRKEQTERLTEILDQRKERGLDN